MQDPQAEGVCRRRISNDVLQVAWQQAAPTESRQLIPGGRFRPLPNTVKTYSDLDRGSPYPPLEEQRAIAHVLGTLDDKIELNRRMNETLEAMARALFRSWFVDFEPVRAKMEGRWRSGRVPPRPPRPPPPPLPRPPCGLPLRDGGDTGGVGGCRPSGEEVELAYGRALKSDDRTVREAPSRSWDQMERCGHHDTALTRRPWDRGWPQGETLVSCVGSARTTSGPSYTTFFVRRSAGSLTHGVSISRRLLCQNLASLAA